jgi:hypothetical protein
MIYDQSQKPSEINTIIFKNFLRYNLNLKNDLYGSATIDNIRNYQSIRSIMTTYHDKLRDVDKKINSIILKKKVVYDSNRIKDNNTHSLNISTKSGNDNGNIDYYEENDNHQDYFSNSVSKKVKSEEPFFQNNDDYNHGSCSEDDACYEEINSKSQGNETLFQKHSGTGVVEKETHVCKDVILLLVGFKNLIISEGFTVINNQLEINLEANLYIDFTYREGN